MSTYEILLILLLYSPFAVVAVLLRRNYLRHRSTSQFQPKAATYYSKERYTRVKLRWRRVSYAGVVIFCASVIALFAATFGPNSAWTNPFGLQNPGYAPVCGILLAFLVLGVASWLGSRAERKEFSYIKKFEG